MELGLLQVRRVLKTKRLRIIEAKLLYRPTLGLSVTEPCRSTEGSDSDNITKTARNRNLHQEHATLPARNGSCDVVDHVTN